MQPAQIGLPLPGEQVPGGISVNNAKHLWQAVEKGRGVIMVSAHLGSWKLGVQCLNCCLWRPVTVVMKKFRYPWLDRWYNKARQAFGNKAILKKGVLRDLADAVRNGEIVVLMMDMPTQKDGVEVEFFGRRASVVCRWSEVLQCLAISIS